MTRPSDGLQALNGKSFRSLLGELRNEPAR